MKIIVVIQTLTSSQDNIKNKFKEIFEIKMDIKSFISVKFKNEYISNKLITDISEFNKYFGSLSIYIPSFIHQLWENPKSISTILLNAEKDDIKKKLANFIVHNLYDNISSLHNKDQQLIYIITILLQKEINSLKNVNSSFLDDSCGGIILKEFGNKKEIKFFFKKILLEIIKKLENNYFSDDILFEPEKIDTVISKKNNERKISENKEQINLLDEKYIFKPFDVEKLKEEIKKYNKNIEMQEYLSKIISECDENPYKYTSRLFFEKINNFENKEKIMNYYKESFLQMINIIDMLFDYLINKIDLLPYSIKCIFKIISILIKKRFPHSTGLEQNRFLIIYFFYNLFFPILNKPSLNAYINEILITEKIIKKFSRFTVLLDKVIKGKLFSEGVYTPFNWYIIDNMPKLFEFFNKIGQVTLPNIIEKLINNELPENYQYNYFNENPNESILYRNICFNIDELDSLINNAQKCKDLINIDKLILSKFQLNIKKLQDLQSRKEFSEFHEQQIEYDLIDEQKIVKYFLLTDLVNNSKFDKILNLKNYKKNYFTLKELKKIETEEQRIENNLIKVKNLFYALLYYYRLLSKNEFKSENLYDIISILKELKTHQNLNNSFYQENSFIPIDWYINSLLKYLPRLPESYIKNNYERLFNELEYEISNSIEELDFEKLTQFIEYFKESKKEKLYYEKIKKILDDLCINKKVEDVIRNEKITIDLELEKNKITQFFKNLIKKDKYFSNSIKNFTKKKKIICTIPQFIKIIPNIKMFELNIDFDNFKILKEKKIPEIIENFFYLLKQNLKEKKIFEEIEIKEIYNKIYDYVMEQLYDNLFPEEPSQDDIKIYKNCFKHQWVELLNLIKEKKNYYVDDFLPDSIKFFEQFEREKSTRKKILSLQNIFINIYKLAKFNGDEVEGADEEMPLLSYSFIQSLPKMIDSNCKYIELFLGSNTSGIEASQLTKIMGCCETMKNTQFENFYNISKNNYDLMCNITINGELNK